MTDGKGLDMIGTLSLNSCIDRTLEMDLLKPGEVNQAKMIGSIPAGKAVNVAKILARLGETPALFGIVGTDTSDFFSLELEKANVRSHLTTLPIRTRINTTIIDTGHNQETHIRECGEEIQEEALGHITNAIRSQLSKGDLLVVSGSVPSGIRQNTLSNFLNQLSHDGIKIIADTSGVALAACVALPPLLIKPNEEELRELCDLLGVDFPSPLEAAKAIASRYSPMAILLSCGKDGAFYISSENIFRARCEKEVEVKNTVGAGDALLAGFVFGLGKGYAPQECLKLGVQTATASLPCPMAGELDEEKLSAKVTTKNIA